MRKSIHAGLQVGIVSAGILLLGGSVQAAEPEAGHVWQTGPNTGLVNGNQALLPLQLPINICGNAAGVAGNGTAGCAGTVSAKYQPGSLDTAWTSGPNTGLADGNQLAAIVQIPVTICGNALGILGDATAWCQGGSSAVIGKPNPGGGHGYGKIANRGADRHGADRTPRNAAKHGYGDVDKDWDPDQIVSGADRNGPAGNQAKRNQAKGKQTKPAAKPQPAARVLGQGSAEGLSQDALTMLAGLVSLDLVTGLLR